MPTLTSETGRPNGAWRRAVRQAARQRQGTRRQRWLLWLLPAAVVLFAVVGTRLGVSPAPAAPAIDGVEHFADLSRQHLTGPIDYTQVPPTGGPHNPRWQNCGAYDQPVPSELAVHALEHGAVWISYQPDLPAAEIQALRDLVRSRPKLLLSPWTAEPSLPSPIVASAWGRQLKVGTTADARLAAFVREYVDGPQTPEPGAPCHGGLGTPLSNP
jgi:hypothetical protein